MSFINREKAPSFPLLAQQVSLKSGGDAEKMKWGDRRMRPILKLPVDAVIWSLVRVSPSIILASVEKTSFCLISTTKSHDVLRKGNASKNSTQNITTQINFNLGIKT